MTTREYPFYLKSTIILFGLVLFSYVLFNLREIFVPLAFALLLGILLNPLSNILEKKGIPKGWSIAIALVAAILVIVGINYFLFSQIARFTTELPVLQKKFHDMTLQLRGSLNTHFGLTMTKQDQMLHDAEEKIKPFIGSTVGGALNALGMLVLIPVYTFLFMFYKTLILNFLYEAFDEQNSKEVAIVLGQTKSAIQSYMLGLLLEALAVAALNVTALLLLGVKYALLLGVLGALLNVLPYIGGMIAILLPVLMATITEDGYHTQILVIIAYMVIQFIDNHFLVPYIVSSKVKINALVSIVIVLLGGMLWGVPGMFLSIPFIGVLKIVFDRIPELKPWGKLLGDEVPTHHKGVLAKSTARTTKATKEK